MLKIKPPAYQYCPFCGRKLKTRTEERKRRKYCSFCHWTYYPHVDGAALAVILRRGRVLLVKRAREPYKNTWMFPAGFIEFGEAPWEACQREVEEETGLKMKKAKLQEVLQSTDDPRSPGHFVFVYRVEVLSGEIKTDLEENKDIAWFSLTTSPKIGWQLHRRIWRKLKRKQASTD